MYECLAPIQIQIKTMFLKKEKSRKFLENSYFYMYISTSAFLQL